MSLIFDIVADMAYCSDEVHEAVKRALDLQNLDMLAVIFRRKHGADQIYEYMYLWEAKNPVRLAFTDNSADEPWNYDVAGYFEILILHRTRSGTDDNDANRKVVRRLRNALKRLTHNRYPVYVRAGHAAVAKSTI